MTTIFTNIKLLVNTRAKSELLYGKELQNLPSVENAYLVVEDDEIADFGPMSGFSGSSSASNSIESSGKMILPCWCDSHTHLVFAESREQEFLDKIRGLSYAEIAARGGGIINSASKLQETSEDELFTRAWNRLEELAKLGTGAVEIKSGYGLTTEAEIKMLRVIKKLRERSNLFIKSTFLGAHTYPPTYKEDHEGYINLIIQEMLPVIAAENLADYIDVFCENGFFSTQETDSICRAGMSYGLKPKLHVNQLNSIGGVETGIKLDALSLDHLETLTDDDISFLGNVSKSGSWKGVCTLLPSAAFFLRMPFQPARSLIDSGCAVALASDFNPGSSPSGNMNLVVAMSCIQMRMLPEEAINAATLNGACAMELQNNLGSIGIGKKANLIITRQMPSLAYLPYAFGSNMIERVMIRGQWA